MQEKRAEWLGAPVNSEASLEVLDLLGTTGGAPSARGPGSGKLRFNKRALDALITPRVPGANVPHLAQTGKDPRRWLRRIQPGYLSAREKRLQLQGQGSRELGDGLCAGTAANFFMTSTYASESNDANQGGHDAADPTGEAEKVANERRAGQKMRRAASERLKTELPALLRDLSAANGDIIRDNFKLRALNDKFPALDRSAAPYPRAPEPPTGR